MRLEKLLMIVFLFAFSPSSYAIDAKIEAKRLLERISGTKVSASHPFIPEMATYIEMGLWYEAAEVALNHPNFLNVTVKQMALKMSTREESIQTEFNDFAAMFIGVVRDQIDARQLLTGNFHYRANPEKIPSGINVRAEFESHIVKSNTHYEDLDRLDLDLGEILMPGTGQMIMQSRTNTVVYNPDPAGLLTTRAFMGAHTAAGTNRRPVEYTFRQFMCSPIEEWADTSVSDARVGRDIDRYPGGDHSKFQVSCKGCHTVMDGFRGAFAKWDFSGSFILNRDVQVRSNGELEGGVVGKMNQNRDVFPAGFVTEDSSFVNNAIGQSNQILFGWRSAVDRGYGVKDFGKMVSESRRFSECMVKRVFDSVCRKSISIKDQADFVREYADHFESQGYNLRKLYRMLSVTKECVE